MRNAIIVFLIGAGLLTACVTQNNFPHNLQIGMGLQMTATQQNAWGIIVPILNIDDHVSSSANLEMNFTFWTDGWKDRLFGIYHAMSFAARMQAHIDG